MKITLQSLRPLLIVSMIMLLTPGFSPQQHAEYDKLWKEIEHTKGKRPATIGNGTARNPATESHQREESAAAA